MGRTLGQEGPAFAAQKVIVAENPGRGPAIRARGPVRKPDNRFAAACAELRIKECYERIEQTVEDRPQRH